MGLLATAFDVMSRRRLAGFEAACAEPVRAQMAVFDGLIRRAASTEWGRRFGYTGIRTPAQFRERVPVTGYEDVAPEWHRAFDGARDVAWPGHVPFFAMSSGTTSGNKWLPVTRDAIRSNRRAGADLVAFMVRRGGAAALAAGRFFYLGGSTTLRRKGQCWGGDASGIMGKHIPFYARSRYLPDPEIGAVSDWEEKLRRIVERYRHADVCALSACPSWAALLFRELCRAADESHAPGKRVGELWRRLSFFVSFGMSFEPYRRALADYVGRDLHYIDTYSSSECGMTAIQDEPGGPLRLIVDNGVFFEFIPAEQAGEPAPPRLHIGEVEAGREYALLISSNGGIWAYPLGDVVRFESLRPPRIAFCGRTQMYLSAFGEHLTLEMLEKAVAGACEKTAATVTDYTVVPRFPAPEAPKPAHRWLVEFGVEPAEPAAFMAAVDNALRASSEDYDTHRQKDFGLEPPALTRVAPRTFYTWMKRKGKLGGQHKVPRVARAPEMLDELLAISAQLGGADSG
ncbi:MAG: GH3 auxin-responsive promoter family protein [Kiritimatiellae bacterium]|nr:GH3 auxin-responsive promoter family protein [Kiritimatiellia bacterium]